MLPAVSVGRRPADPARVAALKHVVVRVLALDESATVTIQQLACREPGCPPVETVIAVFQPGRAGRKWTLHAPLPEITDAAVEAALLEPRRSDDRVDQPAAALRRVADEGEPE